jgi:hypothetical protein
MTSPITQWAVEVAGDPDTADDADDIRELRWITCLAETPSAGKHVSDRFALG